MVTKFEKQYPQYRVEYSTYSWDALHAKLVAAVAGGVAPDVSLAADQEVGQFGRLGGLKALNDFKDSQGYKVGDFLPNSWEPFTIDAKIYAAPAYTDVRGLFYRTDLFQAAGITTPPATLDELLADGKALSNGTSQFGFADQTGQLDVHVVSWLVYAFGGDFYSKDGKTATVTSPAVIKALEYYQSLYQQDAAPKDSAKRVDPWQGFKQGYYAMAHSGPWWMGLQRTEAPEIANKWALAPLPAGPVSDVVYGHPNPWVVPSGAKNVEGAYAWLKFMLDPANQADWFLQTAWLPSRVAAYSDSRLAGDPMVQQWLKLAKRPTNSVHNVPNGQGITEAIYAMSGDIKNGTPVAQAAQAANTRIQGYLDAG
jgi:multiple sugar transport system substrate-binding protein